MGWLVLAALIGILAAGRRYGPVVAEPMPANVPAGELTEGRARLYQRAHAHSRAADALRQGTLRRLGRTLRLGTHPEPHAAARAAAHRTGRDPQELTALLEHPRVDSSTDLVTYAQALQTLEQQTTTVNTPTEENR
ncbi:hypothetical protein [Nesterenkonia sp. NBAIMH1]|uniref:hypothetical protein n=1 Tax=Nesterenkonia sp. NBAIMH1 TaxID=2600320 RepID=UPI00143D727E|nr:hypothetical protein [Nesterenkonia sp. NBAIMH1]